MQTRLSATSKMPCKSWGIPYGTCKTGSRLAELGKVKGIPTVCAYCYCKLGRSRLPNAVKSLQSNLDIYNNNPSEWVREMVWLLKAEGNHFFRWFHCGDLQSIHMLSDICKVARRLRTMQFWLPTMEVGMVAAFCRGGRVPGNLNIRISSPAIDRPVTRKRLGKKVTASYVSYYAGAGLMCPANTHQKGKCYTCRACWDKEVSMIGYPLHVGSHIRPQSYKF